MAGFVDTVSAGVLLFATVVVPPVPFQLSEAEWRARCPIVLTRADLKARGLKLKPIRQPLPEYPKIDADIGRPGQVIVLTRIDDEGAVIDVQLIRSWHPNFVTSAIDAVKQWRFKKVTAEGKPACVLADFAIDYVPGDDL